MKKILIPVVAAFVLVACNSMPIKNDNYPVVGKSSKQIEESILKACQSRGWICAATQEGLIEGVLNSRNVYMVKINIPYNDKGYQIVYEDSRNLDAKNGKIHKGYYRWIGFLNKSINQNLAEQ
ncbi:MAG: hypothetical protein LBM71_02925 [Elusimicrobiota bacterium]|jgi:hypothetical protein|nr:hypothetical protein [Elusimicrobiota bacterium]